MQAHTEDCFLAHNGFEIIMKEYLFSHEYKFFAGFVASVGVQKPTENQPNLFA